LRRLSWGSQSFQSHHSADCRSFLRNFGSLRRASCHNLLGIHYAVPVYVLSLVCDSDFEFRPTFPLIAFGSSRGVSYTEGRRTGARTVPLTSVVMSISMRLRTLSGRAVNAGLPHRSQARKAQPVGTRIRYLISSGAECVWVPVRFLDRLVPTPRLPGVHP
jgi:hypothetical protein